MPTRTFLDMSSSVPKRVSPSGCLEVRRFWLPALLPWHACPALLAHAASAAVLSSGSGSHLSKFSDEGSHESVAECVVLPLVLLGFHSCCDCPLSDSGTQALTVPPRRAVSSLLGETLQTLVYHRLWKRRPSLFPLPQSPPCHWAHFIFHLSFFFTLVPSFLILATRILSPARPTSHQHSPLCHQCPFCHQPQSPHPLSFCSPSPLGTSLPPNHLIPLSHILFLIKG